MSRRKFAPLLFKSSKTHRNVCDYHLNGDAISISVTSTLMYGSLSSHATFLLFLHLQTVTRSVTTNLHCVWRNTVTSICSHCITYTHTHNRHEHTQNPTNPHTVLLSSIDRVSLGSRITTNTNETAIREQLDEIKSQTLSLPHSFTIHVWQSCLCLYQLRPESNHKCYRL